MMTNLLHAIEFPGKMNIIKTNIDDYRELNEIIRGTPRHLKSKKLFFFGDAKEICKTLNHSGYIAEISESVEINRQSIFEYRDILRVLFYRVIKNFLRKKGFYFHKNLVYMVGLDKIEEIPLIRKDTENEYCIHEGFEYNLHLINNSVFLSLTPRIVLTWDKKGSIVSKEEGSGFYTSQGFNRWNSVTRNMLELWVGFLSNVNVITIPIQNENSLIFKNKFSEVGWAKVKESERKGRWV